jgi:hypothetical protein
LRMSRAINFPKGSSYVRSAAVIDLKTAYCGLRGSSFPADQQNK